MASTVLTAQPLRNDGVFNWVYLVDLIVDGILVLFFLFYFNRLFATIISYAIRLLSWHKFRIYIDIESLQISPLAGRIFFKGLRYHGDNETIYIHGGFITWRYWLRTTKECKIFTEHNSHIKGSSTADTDMKADNTASAPTDCEDKDHLKPRKQLPCRISVKVSGVEAFLYNRSPAYDAILDTLQKKYDTSEGNTSQDAEKSGTDVFESGLNGNRSSSETTATINDNRQSKEVDIAPQIERNPAHDRMEKTYITQPPAFLRLLPISVEVNKGAAVLGNDNTRSIISARFDSATGTFDASRAGPMDLFKILIGFDVEHPYIQMKPNVDFKKPQLAEADATKSQDNAEQSEMEETAKKHRAEGKLHRLVRMWMWWPTKLRRISIWQSGSTDSIARANKIIPKQGYFHINPPQTIQDRWIGLARYLDTGQRDEHQEWESVEYAKSSILADIQSVGLLFFWEIPGLVSTPKPTSLPKNINGSVPPDYGIDLFVRGGQVTYGPWADRHRVNLQQIFFPASFADATPAVALKSGEARISTIFKLRLIIEGETVLRIPFREASKDWRWKGRAASMVNQNKGAVGKGKVRGRRRKNSLRHRKSRAAASATESRPFAWFDIKVAPKTVINYEMDMLARTTGYENKLQVDVSRLEIFSSLNHSLLWRSGNVAMNCDLSNSLAWNELRVWLFDITINHLDLFLLRDHTFLLVDLIGDWSAGPLPDFLTFIPFRYLLKVHFNDFKMYLNTNDANIINNSEDFDDNEFVILYGRELDADLVIPLDRFRPISKDIKFDVTAHDLGFEMCMPSKNTLSVLLKDKKVARLESVILHGVYTACSEVKPGYTDTLNLEIMGKSFTISFFGFLARHLAKIKENYFGESVHFRTPDEYQDLLEQNAAGTAIDVPSPVTNDLDVILDICAEDVNILLPVNLYEAEEHIRIRVDTADVDLRVNSYYLELMVNSTPLELDFVMRSSKKDFNAFDTSSTQLFLDGVKVYGHRLFGLPPSEPAYVSNWDIDAGSIRGECSSNFLAKFAAAGQSLALTINDAENAQPVPQAVILHDSTFVRFRCPLINIGCNINQDALIISTGLISGSFNDWANNTFSQRLSMTVPDLTLACINGNEAVRHRIAQVQRAETFAHVKTSIGFSMVQRNLHFGEQRALQQDHIRVHDHKAPRSQFLLHNYAVVANISQTEPGTSGSTSIPLPHLPPPLSTNEVMLSPTDTSTSDVFIENNKEYHTFRSRRPPDHIGGITDHNEISTGNKASHSIFKEDSVTMLDSTGFTSCFKTPYFPLASVEPDLSDVPQIHDSNQPPVVVPEKRTDLEFNDFDDDAVHTSFMISVEPGITVFCKPEAVRIVANLIERIQPHDPTAMLDRFQCTTVNEVMSSYSKKHGDNSIVDISAIIPHLHIRFVNNYANEDDNIGEARSDRYNLVANDINVMFRAKIVPQRHDEGNATSVHASLAYLAISAQEGSEDFKEEDAALQLVIDDILFWLVDSDQTSIQLSLRRLRIAMASKKVKYLANLIHRTTMLVDGFQAEFVSILAQPEKLLRYLVYELVRLGEGAQDPAFLTRPSYAMRASPDHIRNSDSWKILSRLRYLYQCLSHDEKVRLMTACIRGEVNCPHDSETYVVTTLNLWRSWDTMLVAESFALRILYGSTPEVEKLHNRSINPLGIAIRAGAIKLVIDPNQKPNKFSIVDLAIRLSITPPSPPSGLEIFQDFDDRKTTVLQIHSSKIALHLNWRICDLVDHILKLFEKTAPGQHNINDAVTEEAPDSDMIPAVEEFHIVLVTDVARIDLETIHLHQIMACESLKFSVTGSGWNPGAEEILVNALICAKDASATMHGHDRLLWQTSVLSPSFWITYEQTIVESKYLDILKIAGDSTKLTFDIKDEILGLVEIINTVIGDEALYLYRLAQTHNQAKVKPNASLEKLKQSSRERLPVQVNLALFLNVYSIDIALLNDIRYTTVGRVARLSVTPDPQISSTYQIDFDLKAQSHRITNEATHKSRTVSEVAMPPINGTIRLLLIPEVATISANVSIEKIEFEAGDVYGLVNALGSTQVSTAIEAIKADILTVRGKIIEVFPSSRATKTVKPSEIQRPVIFDGNVVLAGFAVSADLPSSTNEKSRSGLLFDIQSFYIRVANRSKNDQKPLPFPEIRIALKQIGLELRRNDEDLYKNCGRLVMGGLFTCTMEPGSSPSAMQRSFRLSINGPQIDIFAETAPTAAEVFSHLQGRMKDVDLSMERKYLRRLRHLDKRDGSQIMIPFDQEPGTGVEEETSSSPNSSLTSSFAFDLQLLQISYILRDSVAKPVGHDGADLVLTLKAVNLLARGEAEARLSIEDLEVAMVPPTASLTHRARNSALLPEVVINVAHRTTKTERKLAFHAAGKALDLQLDPQFILPASDIERSITLSSKMLQAAAANLNVSTASSGGFQPQKLMGSRKLSSLLVSAEFAGAVVSLHGRNKSELHKASITALHLDHVPQHGRYGQFSDDHTTTSASLRAPGVAMKVQYTDTSSADPSLSIEVRVDASNNIVYPAVVPLILQISDSVKQVVRDPEPETLPKLAEEKEKVAYIGQENYRETTDNSSVDNTIVGADPRAILGKTKLNFALRICKQEFSLSCQPVAKVAAYAKLEDLYITVNTVTSSEHGHFFAASTVFKGLNVSLRHVYSRDGTFSFDIDSIVLSLMNSKHLSGVGGISAILKINPSRAQINAKQLQDILLFREIWMPPEIRNAYDEPASPSSNEPQEYFVQRYKQIAATTAFPWNATVAIVELTLDLDLGQVIGKSSFHVRNLWASSKKTSSSQQNLCIGIDGIDMTSSGRMSGLVELEKVKIRTAIAWPASDERVEHTPLIQASVGFDRLRAKAAFDYQAFAVLDVSSFEFIMYNIRDRKRRSGDRLVAILDGDRVSAYCISSSAALGLSLFQAFERLIQEKEASYDQSLQDIERFLRRKSSVVQRRNIPKLHSALFQTDENKIDDSEMTLSLHTDVVVTLRSVDIGAFPSTLLDHQVLKADANDIQARFAATLEDNKIHSGLGMTLGQLRVALAAVPHPNISKKIGEMTIDEVIANAAAARGGVILRVPKVLATMQTWQAQNARMIDYIFKSTFEGKIDVGWNYSRISFIRGMWATHTRTLASRLGKPLPESAVKIHGAPQLLADNQTVEEQKPEPPAEQQKITAVVKLPQSNYTYNALEPPIIDTPQLRDMGEATPPLEWIGLHRDRLPNITHQIVIVTLLEIAREVEDAYSRILGSA